MAAQHQEQLPLWLDGLPHGNPPRSLAFKLKAALQLQATPTLLLRQSGAALVLPATANDDVKLRKAATHAPAPADEGLGYAIPEQALGPGVRLVLRGTGDAAVAVHSRSSEHPVDGRPWGPHVMRRTADSNLAAAPPDTPA